MAIWQGRATIPLPVVALRPLSLRCPPRCRHHTSLMGVIFTLDAVEGVGFLREHTARVAIFLSTVFFFVRGECLAPARRVVVVTRRLLSPVQYFAALDDFEHDEKPKAPAPAKTDASTLQLSSRARVTRPPATRCIARRSLRDPLGCGVSHRCRACAPSACREAGRDVRNCACPCFRALCADPPDERRRSGD